MIRYSDELIDEIKNNNDIVDVVSQYVHLKRSGRNYFGLCPFHNEKSPSFAVSPDKQIFHCFGCGVGGNVIHFISKIEGINFRESIELLAERANITLPKLESIGDNKTQELKDKIYQINKNAAYFYHENLYKPTAKAAQEYVKIRKLNNATLKEFLIGYSGNFNELYNFLKTKGFSDEAILASDLVNRNDRGQFIDRFRHRLMFPIQDVRGRIIAFGGRVLDDSKPKYINSPENLVYSKGRHLFGLYNAKKHDTKKILIVEGYMDVISLHQRGITNVVASLGTAMTEAQGRLLRRSSEQIILGYDADGAGQEAIVRGLDILRNLGCDVRVLQISGAKDPDEYVTKYGPERLKKCIDDAISLVEFKVRVLKRTLNLDNTADKIKFLNEVAKILARVENSMEQEIYIEKISKDYDISKEALYSEIKKILYPKNTNSKILEKRNTQYNIVKKEDTKISEARLKRENTIIAMLLMSNANVYSKIKNKIKPEDFKYEKNKKILEKVYAEYEKGITEIYDVLSLFEDEDIINHITEIMAKDYGITDIDKGIDDILNTYERENLKEKRDEILKSLEDSELDNESKLALERELNDIIIKLAK
ncbi:MAG: DNA primase [Clostridia bacterium]|jgi:DNA primase|nr:DNA primase [Clostridium sp.]MEE0268590.1 DNA primase [Clostridia bacterium]